MSDERTVVEQAATGESDPWLLPGEEWRPVPGWPNHLVSNLGRVRTLDRAIIKKDGRPCHYKARILSLVHGVTNTGGDTLRVGLRDASIGRDQCAIVSRLVASAFLGLDPQERERLVIHKDGDFRNNRPENLTLGDYQESADILHERGGHYTLGVSGRREARRNVYGRHGPLPESLVAAIREGLEAGETSRVIAARCGVKKGVVDRVRRGLAGHRPRPDGWHLDRVREAHARGLTPAQIAAETGLKRASVNTYCGQMGLRANRPPTRLCTAPDCDAKHVARGYCAQHYRTIWKKGGPRG